MVKHQKEFKKILLKSLLAHLALFIIIALWGVFHSPKPLEYIPSIQVDLIGLPDLKKSELEQASPLNPSSSSKPKNPISTKTSPKPQPINKTSEVEWGLKKKNKKNLQEAINRIKALEAMEQEVNASGKKIKMQAKGNKISKGTSLTGEEGSEENFYIGKMVDRLREHWNLPIWLSRQKLDAKVLVLFDRYGYVKSAQLVKSSGNKQFDDLVLQTIQSAQPFGPPPEEVADNGVTFGFPL